MENDLELLPKMRRLIILGSLVAAFVFIGCGKSDNQEFTSLTDSFFQQWPALHPMEASLLGMHSYDHLLTPPTDSVFTARRKLYKSTLEDLEDINARQLTTQNRIDYYQFSNGLQYWLFLSDTLHIQRWSPLVYTDLLANAFSPVVLQGGESDTVRAVNLQRRLNRLPQFLSQALLSLENSSKPHGEAAVLQSRQLASALEHHQLSGQFQSLDPSRVTTLQDAESTAAASLHDFANRLEQQTSSSSGKSFRLGPAYYQRLFHYILQTDWNPNITLERAEKELRTLQGELYEAASQLARQWWGIRYRNPSRAQKHRLIRRVLNSIDNDRQDPEQIVSYIQSQINQLEDFVNHHKILASPAEQNLPVQTGLAYIPGFPMVSLNMSGPMSAGAMDHLSVQPIPGYWSQDETRSYLEEYNNYALQLQSIYYGIPGKFVQQNYAHRYPSLVRALFPSTSMMNGWAHYAERMMVEEGWGQTDKSILVTQLKWEIRRVLQTIIDHKVHTENMSRSEALALLTGEGFMEPHPAEEVWHRVQIHPVWMSADFIGKKLILNLRHRFKQQVAQDFLLYQFHNQLLSYGSPPVKYLRSLLLAGNL